MLLISSLEQGGAERQVIQLANHLDRDQFEVYVCSLSSHVPLAQDLQERERVLHVVEKKARFDVSVIWRVAQLMRKLKVELVHAFLFDAEMVARLAARIANVPVVISSERNADYRRPLIHSICLRLTDRWFDLVIANSHAGKRFDIRTLKMAPERIRVIPNGVDTTRFWPDPQAGQAVRQELGIGPTQPVVGMVASFKRQKNHAAFFRMAQVVLKRFPDARFLLVGEPLRDNYRGAEDYHREVTEIARGLGVWDRCIFVGTRSDMPAVYNCFDVSVLTSWHEGTPNVLLESMACGVPIVATDVSDNARVAPDGKVGFIVKLNDPQAMAERVCDLLTDQVRRRRFGEMARTWAEQTFSTAILAKKTGELYRERWEIARRPSRIGSGGHEPIELSSGRL